MTNDGIKVEVAYALPEQQWLVEVTVPATATVIDAIQAGVAAGLPGAAADPQGVAVWGQVRDLNDPVQGGDRVEILRPLAMDPRMARRELAASGRVMGQGGAASSD